MFAWNFLRNILTQPSLKPEVFADWKNFISEWPIKAELFKFFLKLFLLFIHLILCPVLYTINYFRFVLWISLSQFVYEQNLNKTKYFCFIQTYNETYNRPKNILQLLGNSGHNTYVLQTKNILAFLFQKHLSISINNKMVSSVKKLS